MTRHARTSNVVRGAGLAAAFAVGLWEPIGEPRADEGPPPPAGVLYLERAPGDAALDVMFLPDDAPAFAAQAVEQVADRLTVTGAYSSGDRFAPEGFVLRRGDATHPWPQGWDGLLLVGPDGAGSIHRVEDVRYGDARYDLRDRAQRDAFLEIAARDRLTAIQSHLLVSNGALDLHPIENAPTFRRRVLFQLADGRIGVFDTSPRRVSLYEAAGDVLDAVDAEMALNLDMGAYDFCERARNGDVEQCGLLERGGLEKLTNVITITTRPGDAAASSE